VLKFFGILNRNHRRFSQIVFLRMHLSYPLKFPFEYHSQLYLLSSTVVVVSVTITNVVMLLFCLTIVNIKRLINFSEIIIILPLVKNLNCQKIRTN